MTNYISAEKHDDDIFCQSKVIILSLKITKHISLPTIDASVHLCFQMWGNTWMSSRINCFPSADIKQNTCLYHLKPYFWVEFFFFSWGCELPFQTLLVFFHYIRSRVITNYVMNIEGRLSLSLNKKQISGRATKVIIPVNCVHW